LQSLSDLCKKGSLLQHLEMTEDAGCSQQASVKYKALLTPFEELGASTNT